MRELIQYEMKAVAGGYLEAYQPGSTPNYADTSGQLIGSAAGDVQKVCGPNGGKVTGGSVTTTATQSTGNQNGVNTNSGLQAGTDGINANVNVGTSNSNGNDGSVSKTVVRTITCNL